METLTTIVEKNKKTYEGKTLKEIKKQYPDFSLKYGKYCGRGDFGLTLTNKKTKEQIFISDDMPMLDRHTKAKYNNYTGTVANLDYSCELFIGGKSFGKTSKHRAKKYLSYINKGIEVDDAYLSSRRPIIDFLPDASEKAKLKTEINQMVHELVEEGGKRGHELRNIIRRYAYIHGVDAAYEKYA